MIDADGYRPNVGIMLMDAGGRLFWGRRVGQESWQFPQGGMHHDETPHAAALRELREEVGLDARDVDVLGHTRGWLRYRIPPRYLRRGGCVGQKQVWFLLRLTGPESRICLDADATPEFDAWRWVEYWEPLRSIVPFKREVYRRALTELEALARHHRGAGAQHG
jgi:putative (di)nucleoside polyphosphate hydrolase